MGEQGEKVKNTNYNNPEAVSAAIGLIKLTQHRDPSPGDEWQRGHRGMGGGNKKVSLPRF